MSLWMTTADWLDQQRPPLTMVAVNGTTAVLVHKHMDTHTQMEILICC